MSQTPQAASATLQPARKKPSIVVYGPMGCGKTRNAERLKKAFGLSIIVDDWQFGFSKNWSREGALLLTNQQPPEYFRYLIVSFADAMRRVKS